MSLGIITMTLSSPQIQIRFRNFSMFFEGIGIDFEKKLVSEKVSVSVSKNFGIEKSIGIGFENFWYR